MAKRIPADLNPADRIRYQLLLCGLSQRAGARALGIDPRTMRYYCSGTRMVPRHIDLAMQMVVILRREGKMDKV
jgi:hypothetical protein